MMNSRYWLMVAACVVAMLPVISKACVWENIDHKLAHDTSGIWNQHVYRGVMAGLTVAEIGGALWEGSESRFGKTMWQGIDSEVVAGISAGTLKKVFSRVRPMDSNNPCDWLQGGSNYSFPSGEAAWSASLVTPYILEYGPEHPAAYGLALLPLYVGVGRLKAQAHWQSDILAGWAIGGISGWYAHRRETPLLVEVLPDGLEVGIKRRF